MLLDDMCRIMGSRERLDEFCRLERGDGICNGVMGEVGECVLYWLGRWWQRRKHGCMGRLLSSLVTSHPP